MNKATGLGDSLLFRSTQPADEPEHGMPRETERPEAAVDRDHPMAEPFEASQTSEPPEVDVSAAPIQPPRPKRPKRREVRDRCTLYIDPEVNSRLDFAARVEGKERSEIATEVLRQHLPIYRVERED